ncbi:phosphate:acyl-[acyl carrier protein] acyltransferase [Roseimicrobium gellanilyticum]|uniref:Phosphate acyltransferase n=1 Tax=Roseimicrobium gellanilyticum TaxID=748857 RepID=A0A366H1A5_9BACT|nr:phosphate acyltransferase PlsX [Roseimicrobium gellanilyticum]RBP35500.1 phosphate:acyl-[acyl carrier protein] acyltransferase [Roseimicrobium gellanilyticum]
MKIVLDAMGGDIAPKNPIGGLKLALETLKDVEKFYITGPKDALEAELDAQRVGQRERIEIVPANQVVDMHDSGLDAVRKKKNSSITVAVDLVKQGQAQAVVSAGHTGASVTAGTLMLGRLEGVDFPGIASPMPNEHGVCYILDAGANPDATARHLVQYAIMGSTYAQYVHGRSSPVVGLMNVGEEDSKGNLLVKEAFGLLKKAPVNFKGNVEGHDIFETELDVIVCDGFTGNVVLKSCEATAKAMFTWLKREIESSFVRKMGALMAQEAFRAVRKRGSYESYGGSPLLGVKGVVIIGHGSSSPVAIMNALRVGMEAVTHEVNPHIQTAITSHVFAHV